MIRLNYKYIIHLLGFILVFESLFMASCLFFIEETYLYRPFIISMLVTLLTGTTLYFSSSRNLVRSINVKEGYLIVSLSWIAICVFGSLPYVLTGAIPDYIDAFFETVSGFTTTGSSLLTDIESLPQSILYWRSLTHWIGGMGIVVLIVAILPFLRIGGMQIYLSEASGFQTEKIHPRIAVTAKRLWLLYMAMTVVLTGLLMAGGMDFFESICHAFGTVATGGFSPKNDSIAGYSPYIQYVIMFFMLVSGINFVLLYTLIKGNVARFAKNQELRLYLFFIFTVGLVIAGILWSVRSIPFETAFRESFFQVVSIITATGYASADYLEWPVYAWLIIFSLMFVGACAGSTGGGVKVVRHLVFLKMLKINIRKTLHPSGIFTLKLNDKTIDQKTIISVLVFMMVYLGIFIVGSLLLTLIGLDVETSFGAMAATLGGIGPGIGTVGPASNFAHIPQVGKMLLTVSMLLGRLELYTLLIIFTPYFWKR